MATALYRRYRPESFSEMIGQAHVTEPLMTALRSERIGHAYLFSGPRGCGKTTSARVLARCLNCAAGPTDSPCGTCPSCVELSRDGGGSLDVVEIDAASHGGVDDARELRERAVFAPARDRFKIFIIDEAHMVTPAGFNALLKIVEEPPPHVKFIFATTEPEKVIGTIRSRTHHYPFRLIAPGALIDYAQSLCDSEGITVEPGVLPLVVRAGGGSVRDTLSILDQLIAGSEGTTVTIDRAAGLLGFTSTELIDEVVSALSTADASAAFGAIDRVVQTGQDPRRFVEDLLERLRDLIVIGATSVDGAAAVFRGVPEAQLNRMFQQSLAFPRGEASRLADLVSSALDSMAGATAPRLQLELLIARALIGATTADTAGHSAQHATTAQQSTAPSALGSTSAPNSFAAQLTAARQTVSQQQTSGVAQTATAVAAHTPGAQASQHTAAVSDSARASVEPAAASMARHSAAPESAPVRAFDSGPLAADMPPAASSYAPGQAPSDYVSAMRTARDFLKHDDAGTVASDAVTPKGAASPEPAAEQTVSTEPAEHETGVTEAQPFATNNGVDERNHHTQAQAQAQAEDDGYGAPSPALASGAPELVPVPDSEGIEARPNSPVSAPQRSEAQAESAPVEAVTLADLQEVWQEILEELQENDQKAWAAISQVHALSLEAETLTIGLSSGEQLNRFKADGAGPLREAIDAALGIQVKYVPRRVALASGNPTDSATAPHSGQQREQRAEPAEDPDPGRTDSAASSASALTRGVDPAAVAPPLPPQVSASANLSAGVPDRLEERLGAVLGRISPRETAAESVLQIPSTQPAEMSRAGDPRPALVKPADDDTPDMPSRSAADSAAALPAATAAPERSAPVPDPHPEADPIDSVGHPDPEEYQEVPEPPEDPYSVSSFSGTTDTVRQNDRGESSERVITALPINGSPQSTNPIEDADPVGEHPKVSQSRSETGDAVSSPALAAAVAPRTTPQPSFVRYGESVVREVLGARFVEERPLPTATESQ